MPSPVPLCPDLLQLPDKCLLPLLSVHAPSPAPHWVPGFSQTLWVTSQSYHPSQGLSGCPKEIPLWHLLFAPPEVGSSPTSGFGSFLSQLFCSAHAQRSTSPINVTLRQIHHCLVRKWRKEGHWQLSYNIKHPRSGEDKSAQTRASLA